MPHDTAKDVSQAPAPQALAPKRKFTDVFRGVLTELKSALKEELHVAKPGERMPASPEDAASEATLCVEEALEISEQVAQGLQHLQEYHRTLGNQIDTILHLEPEAQRQLVAMMWQAIEQMEASLTTVQDAYGRLQRSLWEKRLILASRNQELHHYIERETAQRETIATLRQSSARLERENLALQHELTRQQAERHRVQQQHATLAKQHDALVGEHHELFQRYTRERRKEAQ